MKTQNAALDFYVTMTDKNEVPALSCQHFILFMSMTFNS